MGETLWKNGNVLPVVIFMILKGVTLKMGSTLERPLTICLMIGFVRSVELAKSFFKKWSDCPGN